MREFFPGWKRKLGVATLVMALVFTAGWVRSHTFADCIILRFGEAVLFNFDSDAHGLGIVRRDWGVGHKWPLSVEWTRQSIKDLPKYDQPLGKNRPSHEWHFCGVHFGSSDEDFWRSDFAVCRCSYWHVVIPLTLLSAWLLMSKSRPTKRAEPPITTAN